MTVPDVPPKLGWPQAVLGLGLLGTEEQSKSQGEQGLSRIAGALLQPRFGFSGPPVGAAGTIWLGEHQLG